MPTKKIEKLVEVARSFSYKKSLPNYENIDFFCSQKAEVPESQAEKKSEELYEFCRKEVSKSVLKYQEEKLEEQKKALKIQNTTPTDWHDPPGETDIEKTERFSKLEELRGEQKVEKELPIIQE